MIIVDFAKINDSGRFFLEIARALLKVHSFHVSIHLIVSKLFLLMRMMPLQRRRWSVIDDRDCVNKIGKLKGVTVLRNKSIVYSAVAVLSLSALLAGCSGGVTATEAAATKSNPLLTPTTAPVTLTYSGWGIPAQIQSYQKEIQAFEKLHPNVTIQGQFLPWSGNQTKLIAEAAAQRLPDVMVTSTAWFSELGAKGSYLNLTPYFRASHLSSANFAPGGITGNSINGKLYMIPNIGAYPGGQVVLLYNERMFQKAHLKPPGANWTFGQFVQDAKKLTLDSNGKNASQKGFNPNQTVQWGTNIGYSASDAVWDEMLPAFGGWYWNTPKTRSTIDTAAGIHTAVFLKNLVNVWHVGMPPAASTGIADPFAAGKAAMIYAWTNQAETEAGVVNFPIGVAHLPLGPHGRGFFQVPNNYGQATNGWAIAANTKHPRTAWEFVRFLATSPVALRARGASGVEQLAYRPLTNTWLKMLSPIDRKIVELDHWQYTHAPVKYIPWWGGEYAQFWNDMNAQLQAYDLGQTSVQKALATMQKQADQLLKQYKD